MSPSGAGPPQGADWSGAPHAAPYRPWAGQPLSAATVLEAALSARPHAEAVVARGGRLTYRELDELATRSAGALLALGVRPGDRIAVSLPNDLEIVCAFHGAMRVGAVWVGINRQLAPPEKAHMLGDAEASVFLGDDQMVRQMRDGLPRHPATTSPRLVTAGPRSEWEGLLAQGGGALPPGPDPLAPAAIAYTSGTTGRPKGAVHSQHNLMLPGAALVAARRYGPALRKADCFPLTILNLQVLSTLLVAQAQGTAIVMDRVDPMGIGEWIRRERATAFNGAPAMLYAMATNDEIGRDALETVVDVWSGGSGCPEKTRALFTAKFHRSVHTTYGLTEAPSMVTILPTGGDAYGHSSGRPLPHLAIAVVNPQDETLRSGEVGEITVGPVAKGPWAGTFRPMLGYWHQDEASRTTLRDGVLHTGDLGRLDDDGYLVVEERQSSVILRGGANVYPAEVERVLDLQPDVAASCVLGVADERLGERVVAVIEPSTTSIDLTLLRRQCETSLASFKVPESFVVATLPRNSMGKVARAEVPRLVATLGQAGDLAASQGTPR